MNVRLKFEDYRPKVDEYPITLDGRTSWLEDSHCIYRDGIAISTAATHAMHLR